MAYLALRSQVIRFIGTGAAQHNSVVERNMKTIVYMSQTMLLHAVIKSSEGIISAYLWSMATNHTVWLYIHTTK